MLGQTKITKATGRRFLKRQPGSLLAGACTECRATGRTAPVMGMLAAHNPALFREAGAQKFERR